MQYAILDTNRFYALGLCHALRRSNELPMISVGEMQWRPTLLLMQVIIIRCRFSLMSTHQVLMRTLLRLEAESWTGRLYLMCNEKGLALAIFLRQRFTTLQIHILNDRLAMRDIVCLLTKAPRRSTCWRTEFGLTVRELTVLCLLIKGLPVHRVARATQMSEKQVSTHKCNALKKLNASNLLQLLI